GVPPLRVSASTGPAVSTSSRTATQTNVTPTEVSATARVTHPAWATSRVHTYFMPAGRRAGSWRPPPRPAGRGAGPTRTLRGGGAEPGPGGRPPATGTPAPAASRRSPPP